MRWHAARHIVSWLTLLLTVVALTGCSLGLGQTAGLPVTELDPPPGEYTEPQWVHLRVNNVRNATRFYSPDPEAPLTEFEPFDDLEIRTTATFRYYAITLAGLRSAVGTATYVITESTPPTIADPYLWIGHGSEAEALVAWSPASDAPGLEYSVYRSPEDNITRVEEVLANGELVSDWRESETSARVPYGTDGARTFVNVLVRDPSGNMSAYLPRMLERPEILDLYLTVDSGVGDGQDRITRNFGTNSFATKTAWSGIWSDTTTAVLLADLDDDGSDDLIVGHWQGGTFYRTIYLNGGGSFDPASGITLGSGTVECHDFTVADVDRDGNPEIVSAMDAGASEIHEFDPVSQTITGPVLLQDSVSTDAPADIVVTGDFTGDGWTDLAAVEIGTRVLIFINDQAGTLTELAQSWSEPGPSAADVADFNMDGLDDLFVGIDSDPAVGIGGAEPRVFLGSSDGDLEAAATTGLPTVEATAVAVGTIDNDETPDVALGITGSDTIWASYWDDYSEELNFWQLASAPEWETSDVAVTDLNGDGFLDIISVVGSTEPVLADKRTRLFPGDGYGSFGDPYLVGSADGHRHVAAGRIY